MGETLRNPYIITGATGVGLAVAAVAGVTVVAHREYSHESLELTPPAEAVGRIALTLSATVPEIWSDVHTGPHHQIRDANLVPLIETGDYFAWRDEHPEVNYPPIPELFSNLDTPAQLSPEDIRQVWALAREIKTRRGQVIKDLYTPPASYSPEEAERLLDTKTLRFLYEDKPSKEIPTPGTLASIAHLLRDPTSPHLHKNGFFGVLLGGIGLYRRPAKVFARERNITNDYDTSTWYKRLNVRYKQWGPPALFAANIGVRLGYKAATGKLTRETAKTAIASGVVSSTVTSTSVLAGSNIVNAAGHINTNKLADLFRKREWGGLWHELLEPSPKEDGTYTNDADGAGLGLMTQDEAARQEQHHLWPWLVAFTDKTGLEKVKQAPYGSILDFLANHKLAGLRPGRQYSERNNPEGFDRSKRPDMPAEAVLLLEAFRVRAINKL
jgi:hypothetical protein